MISNAIISNLLTLVDDNCQISLQEKNGFVFDFSIMLYNLNIIQKVGFRHYPLTLNICKYSQKSHTHQNLEGKTDDAKSKKSESKRITEFRKKLRETTNIDDLGEQPMMHPAQKDDPLPSWPNNTNPHTGEVGGPKGPEPTRYGDWERKGRVSDF